MSSEWGTMVQPGVYMIQKSNTSDDLAKIVKEDGSLNYELIYLEIEELSTHIEKLKASNIEIEKYIAQQGNASAHGGEDEDENCMSGMANQGHTDHIPANDNNDDSNSNEEEGNEKDSNSEAVPEEDLEIFREALLENENVIFRMQKELELLTKLVKDQKCGCSFHTHGQHSCAHPATEETASITATEPVPHDRITL